MTHRLLCVATAALLAWPVLPGQDPSPDPLEVARQRLLLALTAAGELSAGAFTTDLEMRAWNPQTEQLTPRTRESVAGGWSSGLRYASCYQGEDELVLYQGRMIARESKGPWRVRHDRLAAGTPLPFLLDPRALCMMLKDLNPQVTHSEVGTFQDRPIEILSVTATGKSAVELAWSGALPPIEGSVANPFAQLVAMRDGQKFKPSPPDLTIDLAFFIDPATRRIQQIKARTCHDQAGIRLAGAFVAVGAPAAEEKPAEDPQEPAPDEMEPADELEYGDGLPKRPIEGKVVHAFDVVFIRHGTAEPPDLDARAKALLGIR